MMSQNKLKADLYRIAAEIAQRKSMPDPAAWPGWSNRVPQKLWRAANRECEYADVQCANWAYELGEIIKQLNNDDQGRLLNNLLETKEKTDD